MSEPLRLVIFDLDGTMIDSHARIIECMTASILAHDFAVPDEHEMQMVIGLPMEVMYQKVLPHAGSEAWTSMSEFQHRLGRKRRADGEGPEPLFPEVRETLGRLDAAEYLLAITTNKGRPGLDHVLDGHDLVKMFVTTRSSHDGHLKPHPDAVHDILRKTGVDAGDCVLVGDTETDVLTALNAGVKSLGVAWGYHPAESLLKVGAHAIADRFNHVPQMVEQLLGSKGKLAG